METRNPLLSVIPEETRAALFPSKPPNSTLATWLLAQAEIEQLLGELEDKDDSTPIPPVKPVTGSIEGTFAQMVDESLGDRLQGLEKLCKYQPQPPANLVFNYAGWVRYTDAGATPVDHPLEDVLVFDTETLNWHPVMAAAVSTEAWYVWLHECLVFPEMPFTHTTIPLGKNKTILAHNAMFDVARVTEAYQADGGLMALCTQSLAMAMNGLGRGMIPGYLLAAKGKGYQPKWATVATSGSLVACYKFYTGKPWGDEISKGLRDTFIYARKPEPIRKNLNQLTRYAVKDVAKTAELLLYQFPRFTRDYAPHPVSWASLLLDSQAILNLHPSFRAQVAIAESEYLRLNAELEAQLTDLVQETIAAWKKGELVTSDFWYSQLDWSPVKAGKNKGMPRWYSSFKLDKGITPAKRPIPLLLKMSWAGNPLFYHKTRKWGYKVEGKRYEKMPHPKGSDANCGNPFSKDYLEYTENGVLSSGLEGNLNVADIIRRIVATGYWDSYRSRFQELHTIPGENGNWLHVPQTLNFGTLSLRQTNKVWLVLSEAKKHRVGTEFKHLCTPLPGYSLVGADVDTQEVRIAALFGDHYVGKVLGGTALSQISFKGEKRSTLEESTDPHSLLAKLAGISRNDAKPGGFRIQYGGGLKAVTQGLQAAHLDWSPEQCEETATQMITAKKGIKVSGRYQGGTDSAAHNYMQDFAQGKFDRLPMTNRKLADSISAAYDTNREHFTTRYNFVIQSTGSDWRHAFLVALTWAAEKAGLDFRVALFRHDEGWFHVRQGQERKFAACMNWAHMMTWAWLAESLGFHDLPRALCGFSAVNVDHTIRKEVTSETVSLSGGQTYPDGYELKPGDLLEEYDWLKQIFGM